MPLDDQNEQFYWVNKDDNVIDIISRAEAHSSSMKIHRSVGIFIENHKEEMLLQQRSVHKDVDPSMWSYSVSGHVAAGQSYRQTAIKEVFEEIGLKIKNLTFLGKYLIKTEKEREVTTFYKTKITSPKIKLDMAEVKKVTWIKISDLPNFVEKNAFTLWSLKALKLTGLL